MDPMAIIMCCFFFVIRRMEAILSTISGQGSSDDTWPFHSWHSSERCRGAQPALNTRDTDGWLSHRASPLKHSVHWGSSSHIELKIKHVSNHPGKNNPGGHWLTERGTHGTFWNIMEFWFPFFGCTTREFHPTGAIYKGNTPAQSWAWRNTMSKRNSKVNSRGSNPEGI